MRNLNSFEKKVLTAMVNVDKIEQKYLIDIIDKFTKAYYISWTSDYHKLIVICDSKYNVSLINDEVCDIITLINYLRDNSYISVFETDLSVNRAIYNMKKYIFDNGSIWLKCKGETKGYINQRTDKIKTGLGRDIELYANSTFHVTQALRDYVNNDFKDDEQIRFEKTMRTTKISIRIALFTTIISIVIGLCSIYLQVSSKSEFDGETQKLILKELINLNSKI